MQFTDSVIVDADPDTLFAYVGNVEKVPQYVPLIIDVQRVDHANVRLLMKPRHGDGDRAGVDAWLRLLPEHRLEWGAGGPANYGGKASVEGTDAGSRLLVTVHVDNHDYADMNRELAAALQRIKQIVEGGRAA